MLFMQPAFKVLASPTQKQNVRARSPQLAGLAPLLFLLLCSDAQKPAALIPLHFGEFHTEG